MLGKKVPMATKPRGAKGVSGRATKERTFFCDFPNSINADHDK